MKVDKNSLRSMVIISAMAVLFGGWALYLGYDTVIIAGILGFLGTVVGYIFGRKDEKEEEPEAPLQV